MGRELVCSFCRWRLVISVCIKLHKVCIDIKTFLWLSEEYQITFNVMMRLMLVIDNNDPQGDDVLTARTTGSRRQKHTETCDLCMLLLIAEHRISSWRRSTLILCVIGLYGVNPTMRIFFSVRFTQMRL